MPENEIIAHCPDWNRLQGGTKKASRCSAGLDVVERCSNRNYARISTQRLASRLMQDPLGAAFARKVLRCKARDEGRMLALFDEERNAAAGHFSCKPFGAVLGGAICFVASLANSPAIRLRLASRISPRQAAPRPHGVLHQPAKIRAAL